MTKPFLWTNDVLEATLKDILLHDAVNFPMSAVDCFLPLGADEVACDSENGYPMLPYWVMV
jgi:hypothetical protein